MAKPLLGHRKRFLVLAAFGIDQSIGDEPGLRETWGEQVLPAEHPQNGPKEARRNARREQGRRRIVGEARTGARNVVRRTAEKSAMGKAGVHLRNTERQRLVGPSTPGGLDRPHLGAQSVETWRGNRQRARHRATQDSLFTLCSTKPLSRVNCATHAVQR